jgi:hypothetical protein
VAAAALGAVCSLNSQTLSLTNAAPAAPRSVGSLTLAPGQAPAAPAPDAGAAREELARLRSEAQRAIADRDALIAKLKQAVEAANREAAYYRDEWKALRLRDEAVGTDLITGDQKRLEQKLVSALQDIYQTDQALKKLSAQIDVVLRTLEVVTRESQLDPQRRADVESVVRATRLALAQAQSKPSASASTLLSSKVIQTRPELRLVVLDVGAVQGAKQGMMFTVFDAQGSPVALVKAVDVRDRILGATVEERFQAADVSPGQVAKVRVQK